VNPYIANTPSDQQRMLGRIGISSIDDLFSELPAAARDPDIALPPPMAEATLRRFVAALAESNRPALDRPSFLGGGAYRRFVPAITAALVGRSEFATPYTPYQPEISQGTLQSAFEFQSVVCELTGLDVSNTGLYDVASATAEGCLMAARITGRHAAAILEPFSPNSADVTRTYAYGTGLRVDTVRSLDEVSEEHACLVVQQPDYLGTIRDLEQAAGAAHDLGALLLVVADPLALALLRSPGDAGADIVAAEGRDLAGPPAFGGPSVGIFAARQQYLRQMPGRIVGRTKELVGRELPDGTRADPRTGYALTLQAREQFIRRERATSNLSTGQALVALAFTITVQALGPHGMREQALACYHRAHDAAARIAALPGFSVVDRGPWFQEFLVRSDLGAARLLQRLGEAGIDGGIDVSDRPEPDAADAVLMCVTEITPPEHIGWLVAALREIGSSA
jgi:glycine dehydrogenase subunit 1